jgi:anti-anti-sigma regulatory factor
MSTIHAEQFGDMVVIGCEGRIVQPEAAYRLRNAVIAEADSRIIVLDFSEVDTVESGGLGMLAYLQLWAFARGIRLKLFNPSSRVLERIERASLHPWQIASVDEMTALLMLADNHHKIAG